MDIFTFSRSSHIINIYLGRSHFLHQKRPYVFLHQNATEISTKILQNIENAKISTKFKIPFSPPNFATYPKSPLVSVLDGIFVEKYFRPNVSFKKTKIVDSDFDLSDDWFEEEVFRWNTEKKRQFLFDLVEVTPDVLEII